MGYDSFEIPDGITPLVGYRGWTVNGDVLSSCYRQVEWPVGSALSSECLRPSQEGRASLWSPPEKHYWSPHLECTCGIYALHEFPKLWENRNGKRQATTKPWPNDTVQGMIHGWGRIIVGDKGFRAQYAKPIALITRPRSKKWSSIIERLAERYGLEVVDAKEVRT